MKKYIIITVFSLLTVLSNNVYSQEWSTGIDVYSCYVWRGTKFGSGPALQPDIHFTAGGFTIGGWGSYNISTNEAAEADLYAGYLLPFDKKGSFLEFTLTDYYYPGTSWVESTSHFIEPMVSLNAGKFSLMSAYMINDGKGDIYMEAGLSAGPVALTLGAGDGAYTVDREFNVCNIGISTTKTIRITDTFSLPVSGSAVLNPSSEQFFIIAGFSL
jgi:uncharacterized protein (TIGR02001 family)